MKFDLIPGTGGVVRFPTERRAKPTLLGLRELAPREDLAAAMADERAGDDRAPDTMAEAGTSHQKSCRAEMLARREAALDPA